VSDAWSEFMLESNHARSSFTHTWRMAHDVVFKRMAPSAKLMSSPGARPISKRVDLDDGNRYYKASLHADLDVASW
jgi:hypothetical protein